MEPVNESPSYAQMTAETAVSSLRATVSNRRLAFILGSVMLGMLLSSLDQTIVGTAMPRVIAELNGLEHYAWVFTAYMLASTVTLPIYGKLSDMYGRRPFYVFGLSLFLLGSALSGASADMTQLILFRAIQGLGAGAMMPIVQAVIGDIFPPAERGKWQGMMMAVFGFSTIIGPTLGGFITDNFGWRWVFYVNMPLGLIALIAGALALPGMVRRSQHAIDYLGAASLAVAAVPMLLAFSWAGSQVAWDSPVIAGLLAFSAVMFVVFFYVESRAAEPVISPGLFRNRIFTVSAASTFLMSGGMFGAIMFLPLYMQGVLGISATNAGAVQTPMMLGFMVSSILGGQLMSRTGRYKALALVSFAVAAVGMALLASMGSEATQDAMVRDVVVVGLGLGAVMNLFTIVVQNAFPFSRLGQVTASLAFFRSIGGTMSVAVFGSMLTNNFQSSLLASMPAALKQAVPADRLASLSNPQALLSPQVTAGLRQMFLSFGPQGQALFDQFMAAIRSSLASSISQIFAAGAMAMAAAFVISLLLKEIPLKRSFHASPAPGQKAPGLALVPEPVVADR